MFLLLRQQEALVLILRQTIFFAQLFNVDPDNHGSLNQPPARSRSQITPDLLATMLLIRTRW